MNENLHDELERELDKAIRERRLPSLHIMRFAVNYRPTKHKSLIERIGRKKREGER